MSDMEIFVAVQHITSMLDKSSMKENRGSEVVYNSFEFSEPELVKGLSMHFSWLSTREHLVTDCRAKVFDHFSSDKRKEKVLVFEASYSKDSEGYEIDFQVVREKGGWLERMKELVENQEEIIDSIFHIQVAHENRERAEEINRRRNQEMFLY